MTLTARCLLVREAVPGWAVHTYIQSRFYRSPEIVLGLPYSTAIDVWSFACILAELYTGFPLFPAETEDDLMICIVQLLGLPPPHIIQASSRAKHFFSTDYLCPGERWTDRAANTEDLAFCWCLGTIAEDGQLKSYRDSKGNMRPPRSKTFEQALGTTDALLVDLLSR